MLREKNTVKLALSADCPSHSRADIQVRDLTFQIDEPLARGGTNLGPTPTDTALAALAGCTNVIAHKCAATLGIDIGSLHVDVTADFDRRGVTLAEEVDVPFEALTLDVHASGKCTPEELERVATEVAKFCPVSKLFRAAGTHITERWWTEQQQQ